MRRIPELDGLRGIAAVVIVVYHLRFMGTLPLLQTAVDLFFVLSGFLITRILLEERGRPGWLRRFYARRSLRIWPAYYLALIAAVVANGFLPRPELLAGWWQYATYTPLLQRYWGETPEPFTRLFSHAWTLAIEEQFYIIWPFALALLGRAGLATLCVPLVAVPVVLKSLAWPNVLLATRSEGLAIGAILALWRGTADGSIGRRGRGALAVLGVLMFSVPLWRPWAIAAWTALGGAEPGRSTLFAIQVLRMNLLFLAVVGLAVEHTGAWWMRGLRRPIAAATGRISYGLYLWHPIVFAMVTVAHRRMGFGGSVWWDAGKVAASFAVAAASWRWFERPILALKDRWRLATGTGSRIPRPHVAKLSPDGCGGEAARVGTRDRRDVP